MTTITSAKNQQNFDTGEGAADEFEESTGRRILSFSRLVGLQLKRTVVFVPIFGVVYLAMAFLWYQGIQAERTLEANSESQLFLLGQPAPQPELLLKQVEGWDTAYRVTLDGRTSRPDDSDLIGHVIFAAESAGLVVIETGTNDDGTTTLGNDSYTTTPLLMKANGTLEGIERFLLTLETDEFAAFEVQASIFTAGTVGYVLTLRGVFYSLPENYGELLVADESDLPVIPVRPVGSAGDTEVAQ